MTDLHTHILPGMDDGSPDCETSVEMLLREAADGVTAVALTPHFYRQRERIQSFLERRSAARYRLDRAIDELPAERRRLLPRLTMAAEVAWVPNLGSVERLDDLAYEGTDYILIEPPLSRWTRDFIDQLYIFSDKTALIPVIAHIDRYLHTQPKELVNELFGMGLPVQISASAFLSVFTRGEAMGLMRSGRAQLLISDCHDLSRRQPNIGEAMEEIKRKAGESAAGAVIRHTDAILERAGAPSK